MSRPRPRHHRRSRHKWSISFQSVLAYTVILIISFFLAQVGRIFFGMRSFVLGVNSTITADQVLAETNQARLDEGLKELSVNDQLSQAALKKGQDMLENQYWAHVSPTKERPWDFIKNSGYKYSVAGENLARDFLNTPEMMDAWLKSPEHRDNILNPKFKEIGIAVVKGKFEDRDTTLVVQMFGAPAVSGAKLPAGTEPAILPSSLLAPEPLNAIVSEVMQTFFATMVIAAVLKLLYDGIRQHVGKVAFLET